MVRHLEIHREIRYASEDLGGAAYEARYQVVHEKPCARSVPGHVLHYTVAAA